MICTGVYATEDDVRELKVLADKAYDTPVMAMTVADGLAGRDFASLARERLFKACHQLALKHGLPEIRGYYGLHASGEFVRVE